MVAWRTDSMKMFILVGCLIFAQDIDSNATTNAVPLIRETEAVIENCTDVKGKVDSELVMPLEPGQLIKVFGTYLYSKDGVHVFSVDSQYAVRYTQFESEQLNGIQQRMEQVKQNHRDYLFKRNLNSRASKGKKSDWEKIERRERARQYRLDLQQIRKSMTEIHSAARNRRNEHHHILKLTGDNADTELTQRSQRLIVEVTRVEVLKTPKVELYPTLIIEATTGETEKVIVNSQP
jgi:hypothetical protein